MANSPGVERAEAFKAMKPNAVIYQVGDKCNEEVKAVLDEYSPSPRSNEPRPSPV
jgi:hypothetical protein